jgi:hypothetical protein
VHQDKVVAKRVHACLRDLVACGARVGVEALHGVAEHLKEG